MPVGIPPYQPPQSNQPPKQKKFKAKGKQFKKKSYSSSSSSDTGASHSFMSAAFIDEHEIATTLLLDTVYVSTTTGLYLMSREIVLNCVIRFDINLMITNLIKLSMSDFDCILGIDNSTNCRATIDCFHGVVGFRPYYGNKWNFYGNDSQSRIPLVSAMEMFRLLVAGNEGFMIYAVDVTQEEMLKFSDNPMVKDFPDEISGFPPKRKIYFSIELISGTNPISRPPYRLALAELKELKEQLRDLLEKGYIRPNLKEAILREAHCSRHSIHLGNRKTYHTLRAHYWWKGMKKEISDFVAKCLTCQQVKAECMRPSVMLDSLEVSQWNWKHIAMDFVTYLPRSNPGCDAIWVIIDRLSKSAHFIPYDRTCTYNKMAKLYIDHVSISAIHDVFHVSILRKYEPDPSHVLSTEDVELDSSLSYVEHPVQILDRKEKQLRNKTILLVLVKWSRHGIEEAT
ncbi:uncharacterized protein [Primulina eburnea]|uniref:uncharacterized protein n=1 Tax=Primulina eburnea TaxID=1245227 RepID=UPI003C6C7A5A